jgi:hypothetical protein
LTRYRDGCSEIVPVRIRGVCGENIERFDEEIATNVGRWQVHDEGIADGGHYEIIFSALAVGVN